MYLWLIFRKLPSSRAASMRKARPIRTAINKSKNMLKAGWFKRRSPLPDNLSYMPGEDQTVLQAVLSLTPKYRIPIHLFYFEGYSLEEIADILHSKPATIGTWLARGRSQLKGLLGGWQDSKHSDYKKAFSKLRTSEDFQKRTLKRLDREQQFLTHIQRERII